jgi:molybdopterin-containing oxidoreductase family membrane subunit
VSTAAAIEPDPILVGDPDGETLTAELIDPVLRPSGRAWKLAVAATGLGAFGLFSLIVWTFWTGIGLWGNNIPVAWAFAITNFVWWIGIGHAGTFISAVLLLFEQRWRASISRFAETMTLFAVMQAGLFPLIHLGRPWFFYWLAPYPATMKVWPNFKSALPWDMAAVATYFTVSLLFWYVGLIPDLATARDRASRPLPRIVFGVFAMGWRGSAEHRRHYRLAYGVLAGLATPLVLSVHSIVSCDFATAILPGWHSTIFPPYFVAGAIFSGFCMVVTLMVPLRRIFHLERVITPRHLDNVCKMILVTGLVVQYSYLCEFYLAWYSGETYEMGTMFHSLTHATNTWTFWYTLFSNVLLVQLFWFRRVRRSLRWAFVLTLLINVGMWTERFTIIALSLQRDFVPSSWYPYHPTLVDWGILAGSLCFFGFLFLLFARFLPSIPASELKELQHRLREERR